MFLFADSHANKIFLFSEALVTFYEIKNAFWDINVLYSLLSFESVIAFFIF